MNYGNAVTITPCVRFQSNRKPGLPVQQGLSDGNRIHKAQTGGRGSPRAVPSLRHPFLPHARNQNTCAGRPSSMQVHRANGLRRATQRVLLCTPWPFPKAHPVHRSRQLQSLSGLWPGSICHRWRRPFPSSRRQCRNYPLRPPGPSERCLAIAPYLEPSEPSPPLRPTSLSLSLSPPFSPTLSLSLPFPFPAALPLAPPTAPPILPCPSPLLLPPFHDLRRPSLPGWRGCSLASDYSLRIAEWYAV